MLPSRPDCADCKFFRGVHPAKASTGKWYYGEDSAFLEKSWIGQTTEEYYQGESVYICEAFPGGIPFDIIRDIRKHYKNIPGDNGIKFEPRQGVNPPE